jgi:hypothetical protein
VLLVLLLSYAALVMALRGALVQRR